MECNSKKWYYKTVCYFKNRNDLNIVEKRFFFVVYSEGFFFSFEN